MMNIPSPLPETSDEWLEREIQAKGLTAPRVTPADIEANIAHEVCGIADQLNGFEVMHGDSGLARHTDSLCRLTICVLILRNGFTVVGTSACASPENFNAELGRKIARENAINKIWPLMGYELRSKLAVIENLKAGG